MRSTVFDRATWRHLVAFGVLAVGFSAAHAELPTYTVVPLERLFGGSDVVPVKINNAGVVAGHERLSMRTRLTGGYVWTPPNYSMTQFGDSPDIYDMNDSGVVAGRGTDGYPTLWALSPQVLPMAAGRACQPGWANAINNAGTAVGIYAPHAGDSCGPVIWPAGAGSALILPTLAGADLNPYGSGAATAVNSASDAVGYSVAGTYQNVFYTHAVLWPASGGLIDLGGLSSRNPGTSQATAINDAGVVVGTSLDYKSNVTKAFVWTAASGMQDMGTTSDAAANTAYVPVAINQQGVAVGNYSTASANTGFVWTQQDGMTNVLNLLDPKDRQSKGLYQLYVHSINDAGQITAVAYFRAANGSASRVLPVILTPSK